MRKKLLAVVMCVCLGMSLSGCGSKDDNSKENSTKAGDNTDTPTGSSSASSAVPSEPAYTEDDLVDDIASSELKVLDYIELASYTGLELTKEIEEVTDEDVQSEMAKAAVELKEGEAVVADGDTAVIDFVGKRDGVAFDGGTGYDYELVIGSKSFIDGFETGLIGVKKGETVDLNLTFPEKYTNAELAGKDVVFTVTVNEVKRKPELTDEWFANYTKYAALEDYKIEVRKRLEKAADEDAEYLLKTNALNTVVENSTVKKYFKSLIEEGERLYENSFLTYASYYNMGLDDALKVYGMTETDYANEKSQNGASYAQGAMIINAIAEDAGLTTEDEEYKTILANLASQYNMDVDTLNTAYGENVVNTSVMSEYVMQYLVKNANVTTKTVSGKEEG